MERIINGDIVLTPAEELSDNLFRTSEITLATFIYMRGVRLVGMEIAEQGTGRCNFIFNIESDDPRLSQYVMDWSNSEEAMVIKRVLNAGRYLKKAIRVYKEWLNRQENLEDDFYGFDK